jgi:hypothetical protein
MIFKFMDQVFCYAFVNTGAEGPVEMERFLKAPPADRFSQRSFLQLPAAVMAERRSVFLDFPETRNTDTAVFLRRIKRVSAACACRRVDQACQTRKQTAEHDL